MSFNCKKLFEKDIDCILQIALNFQLLNWIKIYFNSQ